jgi:hypothetical protein
MNEPSLFTFADGQLVAQGTAKIEMQTPEEYIASTPMRELEEHRWGSYVVKILDYPDEALGEPVNSFYAIAECARADGRGMEPKWALIALRENDLETFREKFKAYCEKTS